MINNLHMFYLGTIVLNMDIKLELDEARAKHERLSGYTVEQHGSPVYKAILLAESQEHIANIIKQLDLTFLN